MYFSSSFTTLSLRKIENHYIHPHEVSFSNQTKILADLRDVMGVVRVAMEVQDIRTSDVESDLSKASSRPVKHFDLVHVEDRLYSLDDLRMLLVF